VSNPLHACFDRDTRTLRLSGALDHTSLTELSSAVSEALAISPGGLVLDLTDVEQLPASALFVLFLAHDTHRDTPMELRARAGSPASLVLRCTAYPYEDANSRRQVLEA
jgi:ABC-type transporter Mla MlaB component